MRPLLLLLLVAPPATARADEPPPDDEPPEVRDLAAPVELRPVVVTPGREEQPAFEAPRSVDAVDQERRSEMQARTLPEALDETTGVMMQRTNRGSGTPIIRGLAGPQNLLVIDGVRFNMGTFRTGPNQYLALLDPNGMERVEVVRGPSSVLYGNGAMGGVVHVLTRDLDTSRRRFEAGGDVTARFGSADLGGGGALNLDLMGADLAVHVGGNFDHYGTLTTGGGAEVPVSRYDAATWRTKLAFEAGPVTLTAAYFGALIADAGRVDALGTGEVRLYDNVDHLAYLRAGWAGRGALRLVEAAFSVHHLEEQTDRFNCDQSAAGTVADFARCAALSDTAVNRKRFYDDAVTGLGGFANAHLALLDGDALRLTTGFELYVDLVASSLTGGRRDDGFALTPAARGEFSDGSSYRTFGLFAHADWRFFRTGAADAPLDLKLQAGARLSNFGAFAPDVPGLGDVAYDFTGAVFSGGLQALWTDRLNVYATFVQGFRAPNLQETTVLGDTGTFFEIPNDTLGPERSDTVEVGARGHGGPVTVGAAWFYTLIADVIDREDAAFEGRAEVEGKQVVRRVNKAEGTYLGVEGDVALALWRLTLAANAAWIEGEITASDGTTEPARRVPPLQGVVTLRYDHPGRRFYAELYGRWAATQDQLNGGDEGDPRICETSDYSGVLQTHCAGTPGYFVLGLRGGVRITDNLRTDVQVHNLTDANYRVHGSGYDGPGIDGRLSVTGAF